MKAIKVTCFNRGNKSYAMLEYIMTNKQIELYLSLMKLKISRS